MSRWQQLCARYIALQLREKIVVAIAALILATLLCDVSFWDAGRMRNRQISQQLQSLQQQARSLETEQQQIQQQLAVDPNAELRAQRETAQQRVAELDQQLEMLTVDLIPPRAMATALREVLLARKQLQLVSLANVPSVPAFQAGTESVDDAPIDGEQGERAAPMIFRHGLTLKVRGSYFELLDYLRAIAPPAGSSNRFFWEQVEYQVDRYPQAEVTLRVYTLGNKETWIGA